MKISIIATIAKTGAIGINCTLPWHLPADLAHFKKLTLGKTVIMGRKTYESIGHPLPKRNNIIISKNKDYVIEGCKTFTSLDTAIEHFQGEDEIFIIGGANIYSQAIPIATHLYLTYVDVSCEGDTYFPEFDLNDWEEVSKEHHSADEKNLYNYSFVTLKRYFF